MSKNLLCLCLVFTQVQAADDLFRERFADPATRPLALQELVPGTRDAYFFTALHQQLVGQSAEFQKSLAAWKAASDRKTDPVSANGLADLESRQWLLEYQAHPKQSLAKLIERLELKFDDARPDAAAAAQSLPTRLDPALISPAAFEAAAAKVSPDVPYSQFRGLRLFRELDQLNSFDDDKTRWFLQHLERSDHPGVVPLIARSLTLKPPVAFGKLAIHRDLTSEQLAALLKLAPALLNNDEFTTSYLAKLRPGVETDFARSPETHAAHLLRCRDFVLTLPPSQNSLKAHVLFHHLRLQAELGNYPKADFLAFLALPRNSHPLLIVPKSPATDCLNIGMNFEPATGCPPIRQDAPLIQEILNHFLSLSDSAKEFAPFIHEKILTEMHARARLLAGAAPARWAASLDPAAFKDLQQETRITFAPGAPVQLAAADAVSLTLDLKNTPDLLVRIYEIDQPSHLARHDKEPDVEIDLDGLVPHHQRHLTYPQAPILLHRETLEFPELSGAGVWLVDFVSGRVSVRALIRKGQIVPYLEATATGQTIRVFDETAHPLAAATFNIGSESYSADANGRIIIPNAPNKHDAEGLLRAGKLATAVTLEPREDQPELEAAFHLEREQLLADQPTEVQLRLRLTNNGHELPLERLENPAFVLTAKLLGGITTERVIAENLKLAPTLSIPFQVPADLRSLTLTLRGTFTPATGGESLKLVANANYQINADLEKSTIATAFFSSTTAGYRLELRGRNGEPLPSRAITLKCRANCYEPTLVLHARTDAQGRIDLGKLDTIDGLTASGTGIAETSLDCDFRSLMCASPIQIAADTDVRLPLEAAAPALDRLHFSLLEVLGKESVRDHFDKLSIADGHLLIRHLPAGDFILTRRTDSRIKTIDVTLHVSAGVERDGLLISATRIMPRLTPVNPSIAKATAENGRLALQIRDAGPHTRVTVVGKRYVFEGWQEGVAAYPFEPAQSASLTPGFEGCGYLSERRLSDEMRYILERRAAKTFPGSLLPRPGLLLNRWTEDTVKQNKESGRDGGSGMGSGHGSGKLFGLTPPSKRDAGKSSLPYICDFLKFPAVVRFDLTPQPDGSLSLLLADFSACQSVDITVADEIGSDRLTLPLPATDTPLRERRIARPLDPAVHFLATRNVAVLATGQQAGVENLLDADWRAFTTLGEAHQLLHGFTNSDVLREFSFLTEWPDLTEARKLDLLAKHACHELHLFLARKDKPFFDKHVKPLLAAKLEPQFIDDLLLGRDLAPYLRPYAWQRLNAAEKALLAQAVPAAHATIANELKLRWQSVAPSPETETVLFTQTLGGRDLSSKDGDDALRRCLYTAEGYYNLGKYNEAKLEYEKALRIDIYNPDARRGLEAIASAKSSYYRAAYDETRSELMSKVNKAWELSESTADPQAAAASDEGGLGGGAVVSSGVPYINEKLRRIIIPNIAFDDVTVEEAIDFLRQRASELDTLEVDDSRKGINILLRRPQGIESRPEALRIKSLRLTNIPIGQALKYICDAVSLRYKVDDYAVTLVPRTETGCEMFARGFRVPSDFQDKLRTMLDRQRGANSEKAGLKERGPVIEILKMAGINFGEGSSATLGAGGLLVTNSAAEMDKIESLVEEISGSGEDSSDSVDSIPQMNHPSADPFCAPDPAESAGADPFAGASNGGGILLDKPAARQQFQDRSRLYREANYYRHSGKSDESLIAFNRFWLDLAAWDGKGAFLSPNFNACGRNANEALMCLAVLDLPFKAERPDVTVDGSTLRVKARAPMLLFYKDTRRSDKVAAESPLLVRQSFCPLDEPYRSVDGRKVENFITGDFQPGVPYSASLIVTNPTGLERQLDVLAQIPAGTIPLAGKPATLAVTKKVAPFGVLTLTLSFYFPAAGEFPVYPLHVTQDGVVVAHSGQRPLRVTDQPAPEDRASWAVLARDGSNEDVLKRLQTENLNDTDLDEILWRLKDRAFFLKVTQVLRDRLCFSVGVWAYGFHHDDPETIRTYLENSLRIRNLGAWLDSPLLSIRPRVHGNWQTLEFDPLINPRAHRFGEDPRLTHPAASQHYQEFLDQLAWKPALDSADQLDLTVFLLLQDRIEEALERFAKIDPAKLPSRLHYDYLQAVVLFHQEKPADARAIAANHLPALPAGLWHDRFQTVIDQADEITALAKADHSKRPALPASVAPMLDLTLVADGKLVIKHRGLDKATLRLFSVDLEVLFSKDPFLKGDGNSDGQPSILPNEQREIVLAKDPSEMSIELPPTFRKGNVLIAAQAGNTKLLKVLDSKDLDLRQDPVERTVQVLDSATFKPLPKTYIKVYAETKDGRIAFHKDGYTDLRGKFDYLSHTGVDPSTIKRVALLVAHPERGSRTVIFER